MCKYFSDRGNADIGMRVVARAQSHRLHDLRVQNAFLAEIRRRGGKEKEIETETGIGTDEITAIAGVTIVTMITGIEIVHETEETTTPTEAVTDMMREDDTTELHLVTLARKIIGNFFFLVCFLNQFD